MDARKLSRKGEPQAEKGRINGKIVNRWKPFTLTDGRAVEKIMP
jgi:hypothetical protein